MTARWTRSADVVVVGLGMSAGPVLDAVLNGGHGTVEVIDRGELGPRWPDHHLGEHLMGGRSGLSVPADEDWVEMRGGSGRVTRVGKWWAARWAGGGAWLWYGQLSRFRESDLAMPGRLAGVPGHQAREWPICFAELTEHYRAVESVLLPYGHPYGMSDDVYSRVECAAYARRPRASAFEQQVIDRLAAGGLRPYVGQTALGGRAWDMRPTSPTAAVPDDDGLRPPLRTRRTWIGVVRDRLLEGTRCQVTPNTTVVRVFVDRGEVSGLETVRRARDNSVVVERIRARTVILACGALETIRILLMSELPNRNGLLGASFTLTQERVAYIPTDIERDRDVRAQREGTYANVVVKDFYDGPPGGAPVKCGKFALYDGYAAELPHRHARNLGLQGEALKRFVEDERRRYAVKVSFKGESIPWEGKYVELGASRNHLGVPVVRMRYEPHPYDREISAHAVKVIRRLAALLGSRRPVIRPLPTAAALVSAHHHGGAVFGADPQQAVVDANGECYEARGLHIADSSVMPTSGATNSTLTAMALAHRLAHARFGPSPRRVEPGDESERVG